MCDTCGCDQTDNPVTFKKLGKENDHSHDHKHPHTHDHGHDDHNHEHSHSKVIQIEQDVLNTNNLLAQRNRGYFEAKNIVTLNMVSSPGSGKTTLLEKTITDLKKEIAFFVIEGDEVEQANAMFYNQGDKRNDPIYNKVRQNDNFNSNSYNPNNRWNHPNFKWRTENDNSNQYQNRSNQNSYQGASQNNNLEKMIQGLMTQQSDFIAYQKRKHGDTENTEKHRDDYSKIYK